MNASDVLDLWKNTFGDPSPESWGEDSVFGFFQRFRPRGEGLEPALSPLPCGREVHSRLLEVYSATALGWQTEGRGDMYFIVRNPPRVQEPALRDLAHKQVGSLVGDGRG